MSTDFRGLDAKGLPLVSIVAVSYNHEQFLEETLDSIKAQTYPNIQLIIMDDRSQDRSVEKIEKWIEKNKINCKFIAHKENQGLCKTLNEALGFCEGEYYQAIACDDIMLDEKIYTQIQFLEKTDEDTAMVYTDALIIDENSHLLEGRFIARYRQFDEPPSGKIFQRLVESNFIPAMSVLIKRKNLNAIGKYDEALEYEDYDMWLRIAKKYKIIFMDIALVVYRIHSNNLHPQVNYVNSNFKIYMKHMDVAKEILRPMLSKTLKENYKRNEKDLKIFAKQFFQNYNKPFLLKWCIKLNFKYHTYYKLAKTKDFIKSI